MGHSISLRKRILFATAISLIIFIVAELVFLVANKRQQDSEISSYANEVLDNSVNKLKDMDSRLRVIMGNLSVNPSLSRAVTLQPSMPVDDESILRSFETLNLAINASNEIVDIALVNNNGIARSYITGWAYSHMTSLSNVYNFRSTSGAQPIYIYPNLPTVEGRKLFFLIAPLWKILENPPSITEPGTRVGSIIFACDLSALMDAINQGGFHPLTLKIMDGKSENIIAEHSLKSHRKDIVKDSYIEGLDVTVRLETVKSRFYLSDVFVVSIVLILLLAFTSQFLINRLMHATVLKPISNLSDEMLLIQDRPDSARLGPLHIYELDPIVKSVNRMLDALDKAGNFVNKARLDLLEAQLHRNESELYALQSQINPHFLFNTLQCIRALALSNNIVNVASVTSSMADLMRYALNTNDIVTLGDEISITKKYLSIIDIRYQQRIHYSINVSEELFDIECLRMIIQPLVDNAVNHGLSMIADGGKIEILAQKLDQNIIVEVQDNGCGIDKSTLDEIEKMLDTDFHELLKNSKFRSYGLYNIHKRIQIAYGNKYGLKIDTEPGRTKMTILLPLHFR